ncbi:VTT domain-containing protein [Sansalvadorimonas sp. 2012CJ34-2]|uniref:VTT domain-containing protein n=1 Tax=Parendozoicomonas callyspongiae TaxID=2942213 RepID=A0ABT0PCZ9_9GAMM|nr:VTT domain-containing protein [Sansalvadorimonas sp. 2012CJ34-2]MCL6269101.1 VTT domain-containing protein [Sansalvadorimonas sp. 2012CJ34-2]
MDLISLSEAMHWLQLHKDWLALIIAAVAFLESLALVGLVLPGVVLLFAAATIAGSGVLDIWSTLLAGFIGAVLGDGISFILGQVFHKRIRGWWLFRSHPEWLEEGESFFHKHGGASIALGRFIGPVRPVIPLVAGMLGMSAKYFYFINIISSVVWSPVYLLPGYLIGASVHWQEHIPLSLVYLVAGVLVFAWLLAFGCYRFGQKVSLKKAYSWTLGLLVLMGLAAEFFWFRPIDIDIQDWALSIQTPLANRLFTDLTLIGEFYVQGLWVLLVGLWLLEDNQRRQCGRFLLLALTLHGLHLLLKFVLAIERPAGLPGYAEDWFSWPSGHASFVLFMGLYVGRYIAFYFPKKFRPWCWWVGLSFGLLMGFSRVYLNVHWASDVFGGFLLGGSGFLIWLVLDKETEERTLGKPFWWRVGLFTLATGGVLTLIR